MSHHDPPIEEQTDAWRSLQAEQLELRRQLAEDGDLPDDARNAIVARFQRNKVAIAEIERGGQVPPTDPATGDQPEPEPEAEQAAEADRSADIDPAGRPRYRRIALLLVVLAVVAFGAGAAIRLLSQEGRTPDSTSVASPAAASIGSAEAAEGSNDSDGSGGIAADRSDEALAQPAGDAGTSSAPPEAPPPPRRIALVTPGARDDHGFNQSMADAVELVAATRDNVELTIIDQASSRDQAAEAIRDAAADGHDLVVVHSSTFRSVLQPIAAEHPDVTFAVGTVSDAPDLPNVYTYSVAVEEGGSVLGAVAARLSETAVVGAVGPVEVGTSQRYIEAFRAGAEAERPDIEVLVTYTGSFDDAAAAAGATQRLIDAGADVITGQGHRLDEAVAMADASDVHWLANQVDQRSLAPTTVVASQVYHWRIVLDAILADVDDGAVDGRQLAATFANGGLSIELNAGSDPPDAVQRQIDRLVAELVDR